MLNRMAALSFLDRFSGLDWFVPQEKRAQAMSELASAMEACLNEGVATIVVNEWLYDQREWPKPADLRRRIWEENESVGNHTVSHEKPFQALHCNVCKGYGIAESTHADDLLSVARYCECEAGKQKQENDCKCEEFCGRLLPDLGDQKEKNQCCFPPWRINQARFKLLKKFGNKPLKQMINEALK